MDEASARYIAQLVAEHHRVVYAYAYRLTGSSQDAEDLAQQTFLVALEKYGQVRQSEAVRGWLCTVTRNLFLKSVDRQQPLAEAGLQVSLENLAAARPEEDWIDHERLQQALNELSAEFRVVLTMFYFESFSYREISEKLDVPIGTVMSRLARAKQHLRARLLEAEMEPGTRGAT